MSEALEAAWCARVAGPPGLHLVPVRLPIALCGVSTDGQIATPSSPADYCGACLDAHARLETELAAEAAHQSTRQPDGEPGPPPSV